MATVSIILPCYNEENTIAKVLEAIYFQTFPCELMETIICDGNSSDSTIVKISEFIKSHPEMNIRIINNPKRIIPAALNVGINAAEGDYIIRMDGHSIPDTRYVELCVKGLEYGCGDNVGGVWRIEPGNQACIARSIAFAAAHPLGIGDARYRHGAKKGEVDTVPFGSFQKKLFDKIGYFDETLLANEDYEFNARIRKSGGKIWMDPDIKTVYIARSTFTELIKQYFRYGYWKVRMLKKYPSTIRWRQALPPLFVSGILILSGLALFFQIPRVLLLSILALYITVLVFGSLKCTLKNRQLCFVYGIPIAIVMMHFSWGLGFIFSLINLLSGQRNYHGK